MQGISAWNRPKKTAIVKMLAQLILRTMAPLAMDTEKQSMARAMPSNQISKAVMSIVVKLKRLQIYNILWRKELSFRKKVQIRIPANLDFLLFTLLIKISLYGFT